jgi:hypothetical protein
MFLHSRPTCLPPFGSAMAVVSGLRCASFVSRSAAAKIVRELFSFIRTLSGLIIKSPYVTLASLPNPRYVAHNTSRIPAKADLNIAFPVFMYTNVTFDALIDFHTFNRTDLACDNC